MHDDATTQRVIALELSLLEASVRASVERLDDLLEEDFVEFGASGRRFGKREVLAALPGASPVRYRVDDMQARWLAPDLLQLTYRSERDGDGGRHGALRSSLWRCRDDRWRMLFHQGTPSVGEA
ncbi:DUF4440 domain-containing protein [Xanthomonas bundabergensis]|uniref:nuclear transport factor 2 family protein n=1 Tax=Xanthomonas bundabergensis TaxID=3160842 RepID=UPI003516C50D